MREKDKMLAGEIYDANYDKELIEERLNVKDKCFEYNNIKPSNIAARTKIMSEILGKHKNSFYIEPPFYCDYGYNIEVGENFYSNHNLIILDGNKVIFGDNVFIAPNCGLYEKFGWEYVSELDTYIEIPRMQRLYKLDIRN